MNGSPTKQVYFIRHGESTFNAYKSEEIDCGLTELGKKQCQNLGERLRDIRFELVIVSPLARALQTFEISKITYDRKEVNPLCREYKVENCDFLAGEEIVFEKEDDVKRRCLEFRSYIETLELNKIAVVCHADFIYYFTCRNNNEGIWLENADFTIVNF
jgi:broad specificity phosphatase PhoE